LKKNKTMSAGIISYATALTGLMSDTFTNYKGRIIERVSDGFKVGSTTHQSIEQAKEAIDNFKIKVGRQ